jgi:hypothetical protein
MRERRPRKLTPEMQEAADMLELMGAPAFHRFLYTIMARSGICAATYGTDTATSYQEGRRSLGIDILRMADDILSVRSPDGLPFAVMAIAISEGMRVQTQEPDNADISEDDEDEPADRR